MKRNLTILLTLALAALSTSTQGEIFIARHDATLDGFFNQGRVRINATFDGTDTTQWQPRGNSGIVGDGTVWHGFARYKMFERDLFNTLDSAGQITWTTGLIQKEINRTVDDVNGGHDVDVYLSLDPNGTIVPSGELPGYLNAWDWSNEFGLGWENRVYLGRVLQSEPMATVEEKTEDNQIPQDSSAMRITFDVTTTIKDWIQQGLLTSDSTIAFGVVQRAAVIVDEQGNPSFTDPKLYEHNQMVFEVGNAFIETGPAIGPPKGPGAFSDYDLVDGYVDTGSWLGMVEVTHYPWSYVVDLSKYVWVDDSAGWIYIPR